MKVYIADDSPVIRSRLVKLLMEQRDVEIVGQTGDAYEAVEAIRRLKPNVVILAMHMYNGNGIEVLRGIRSAEPAPVTIVLTNSAYAQYRNRCLQAGADYFFDKSNEFDQLSAVLKQLAQAPDNRPTAYSAFVHGKAGSQPK